MEKETKLQCWACKKEAIWLCDECHRCNICDYGPRCMWSDGY